MCASELVSVFCWIELNYLLLLCWLQMLNIFVWEHQTYTITNERTNDRTNEGTTTTSFNRNLIGEYNWINRSLFPIIISPKPTILIYIYLFNLSNSWLATGTGTGRRTKSVIGVALRPPRFEEQPFIDSLDWLVSSNQRRRTIPREEMRLEMSPT